jgi:hypothetical protein
MSTADDAELRRHADVLLVGVEAALPSWVERSVARRMTAWSGCLPSAVAEQARAAGVTAVEETIPRLQALLDRDVDEQRTTPLEVVRSAARFPAGVLAAAGVAPVARDELAERAFPDDVYDLVPASWADIDPSLVEPGLTWGAAKAYVVLHRRREEGRR